MRLHWSDKNDFTSKTWSIDFKVPGLNKLSPFFFASCPTCEHIRQGAQTDKTHVPGDACISHEVVEEMHEVQSHQPANHQTQPPHGRPGPIGARWPRKFDHTPGSTLSQKRRELRLMATYMAFDLAKLDSYEIPCLLGNGQLRLDT